VKLAPDGRVTGYATLIEYPGPDWSERRWVNIDVRYFEFEDGYAASAARSTARLAK
jgi:hypothetical protein